MRNYLYTTWYIHYHASPLVFSPAGVRTKWSNTVVVLYELRRGGSRRRKPLPPPLLLLIMVVVVVVVVLVVVWFWHCFFLMNHSVGAR